MLFRSTWRLLAAVVDARSRKNLLVPSRVLTPCGSLHTLVLGLSAYAKNSPSYALNVWANYAHAPCSNVRSHAARPRRFTSIRSDTRVSARWRDRGALPRRPWPTPQRVHHATACTCRACRLGLIGQLVSPCMNDRNTVGIPETAFINVNARAL